mgnify:CR=1 FL=1
MHALPRDADGGSHLSQQAPGSNYFPRRKELGSLDRLLFPIVGSLLCRHGLLILELELGDDLEGPLPRTEALGHRTKATPIQDRPTTHVLDDPIATGRLVALEEIQIDTDRPKIVGIGAQPTLDRSVGPQLMKVKVSNEIPHAEPRGRVGIENVGIPQTAARKNERLGC